ncbi:unnamed protein product [Lupinus luteus]|uniref:Uncharacterized protein n=1 Tax=Lupinus luteus TaxID=3873 RepID=A0AAV1X5Q4_LUPLU
MCFGSRKGQSWYFYPRSPRLGEILSPGRAQPRLGEGQEFAYVIPSPGRQNVAWARAPRLGEKGPAWARMPRIWKSFWRILAWARMPRLGENASLGDKSLNEEKWQKMAHGKIKKNPSCSWSCLAQALDAQQTYLTAEQVSDKLGMVRTQAWHGHPHGQHTPSCSSRQISEGACAPSAGPSTMPDQQAPGQVRVSTVKAAQAGCLADQLDRPASCSLGKTWRPSQAMMSSMTSPQVAHHAFQK